MGINSLFQGLMKDRAAQYQKNSRNHLSVTWFHPNSPKRFKYGNNIKMGDNKVSKYRTKPFMGYNALYNDTMYSKEASKI